ncbi:hypothetical protein PTTG_03934 [Puccinia triticina 1-1 BBBD Race 1]|uniref:CxC1 domain-containing protein n=1 Tax=Puccinia triticina (isolate 1-1 / race 1 (BBBD)) TaxID=630390 RepID=A0A180GUH4_PUCT1|nr:hypothetical protein PTTG_03934 [Puccinia triticina 1-1 BBBD Race 1]
MAKKRVKRKPGVLPLAVRLRREANVNQNFAALQRLQGFQSAMARMDQIVAADTRLAEDLESGDWLNKDNQHDQYREDIEGEDEDSESDWAPIDYEEPDEIDLAIESNIERLQQESLNFNWTNLVKDLYATYLAQKAKTKNWTKDNCYSNHSTCECISATRRAIDLVDVYCQQRAKVKFCPCQPDAVRLLRMGYLPGSPIRPVTAFSIPLLILHNSLWNNCHIGALPFTTAMKQFLEPRSERLTFKNSTHSHDLRKPFSAAVDLFRELEDQTDSLIFKAMRLEEQTILACRSCPACFGPAPTNLQDYPQIKENKLIICLDGNFQHCHIAKASRDYHRINTPSIFLKQQEVDKMKAEIRDIELRNKPKAQKDQCTESHKAANDKRNKSSWKGCDDTGLMGCCCRHDSAIYMANINKSGEQRCFPMALITKVVENVEVNRHIGILYDIGCSLDKFIELRGLLDKVRGCIKFGTSIFHAYVHSWACQLDYNPRLNEGWGLSDGEGLERMWSFLSPLISLLRLATRNHRLGALAHKLKYHNNRGIRQLLIWLKNKFLAAVRRRAEVKALLSELLNRPNPFSTTGNNYTKRFFKSQWEEQRRFKEAHTEEQEEHRAKLLEVYKQEAALDALRQVFWEVHDLLDKLEETAQKLKNAAESLGRTERPHPDDADEEQKLLLLLWDAKSALYVQAVQLWAERQPLTDSRTLGRRLGTKLSEKIQKAIQSRRGPINKLIAHYNTQFDHYVAKFPRERVADAENHPLTYEAFASMAINHKFWNDGIYYHSKAPWATNPDVRTGITCILVLGRVDKELDLITQELARAMSWGVDMYTHMTDYIKYIRSRGVALENDNNLSEDHLDNLEFGDIKRGEKLRLINKELQSCLFDHGTLMIEWSDTVKWMCARCQPNLLRDQWSEWTTLIATVLNNQASRLPSRNTQEVVVDIVSKDVVLGVQTEDGEELGEADQGAWEDIAES